MEIEKALFASAGERPTQTSAFGKNTITGVSSFWRVIRGEGRTELIRINDLRAENKFEHSVKGVRGGVERRHGRARGRTFGSQLVSKETIVISMETIERPLANELERYFGYWLRRVSNHVSGKFKRALRTKGTSVAEWVVLCHVQERPGITPGELAEALGLTRGAVSKVIDKLEAKDWILGSTKPGDQRVRLFRITRKGGQILPELRKIADSNDRAFFCVLDEAERGALQRLLFKLIARHDIQAVPIQ